MDTLSGIELEIQWTRLIAIVDEVGAALRRTAFSTVTREANDFACVLLDGTGSSLVQATESVPSFIGTLPVTTRHLLRHFGRDDLRPGDVLITNDPWLGTGHLPDVTMVTPVFRKEQLVAFSGSIIHLADVGGGRLAAEALELYEEGLRVPPVRLYEGGRLNVTLADLIRANVRVADQVWGDLQAQAATNELAASRLLAFMDEVGIDDLAGLAGSLQSRSERAMRAAIERVPDGVYRAAVAGDGYDEPIEIRARLDIRGSTVQVDYSGSSPQSPRGINSVPNYTYASTAYALKCLFDPTTPNNEGCFRPIQVEAPLGSILNPRFPAPVNARHVPGHLLQAAMFEALAPVMPERVQADSGLGWPIGLSGRDSSGRDFSTQINFNGGQGARYTRDGTSTLSFPSNAWNTPVEVIEAVVPVLFEEKALVRDSGGAGRQRGGCGQRVVLRCVSPEHPVTVTVMADRLAHPASGLLGGRPGSRGEISSSLQTAIRPKDRLRLRHGDRLVFQLPGGGGVGDPAEREPARVARDLRDGYISVAQAVEQYGLPPPHPADEGEA